ncbi:hypothetical protein B9Z55_008988 [Caenorhabditis nigoni]|nr:hypothetical protein B9Z55_008988 [Caenorhabditis nigoni]
METYLENVVKRITVLEKNQKESLAYIENGIRTTVQNPEDLQSKMRRNERDAELAEILVENVDKSLLLEIKNFLDNVFSATMEKFESLEKADRLEQEEDSDERLEELYGKITQD